MPRTVAVLCTNIKTHYRDLPDVEVYDKRRDCRTFTGTCPIVAHPPCRAWSKITRHQAKPEPGEKDLAPFCIDVLKANGGVLEHPAHSVLFDELKLPKPTEPMRGGLWSMAIKESWFEPGRNKKTWLLFAGVSPALVFMPFALQTEGTTAAWDRMSKERRRLTPAPMARWLVDVARTARVEA